MRFVLRFPDKVEFDGDIDSLMLPLTNGYVTIHDNHEPFIGILADGMLEAKNGETIEFSMGIEDCKGILTIENNIATVLIEK